MIHKFINQKNETPNSDEFSGEASATTPTAMQQSPSASNPLHAKDEQISHLFPSIFFFTELFFFSLFFCLFVANSRFFSETCSGETKYLWLLHW